jgi:hypothetical protein
MADVQSFRYSILSASVHPLVVCENPRSARGPSAPVAEGEVAIKALMAGPGVSKPRGARRRHHTRAPTTKINPPTKPATIPPIWCEEVPSFEPGVVELSVGTTILPCQLF